MPKEAVKLPAGFSQEEYQKFSHLLEQIERLKAHGDYREAEELEYQMNRQDMSDKPTIQTLIVLDGHKQGGIHIWNLTFYPFNMVSEAWMLVGKLFNKNNEEPGSASLPYQNIIANLDTDPFLLKYDLEHTVKKFVQRVIKALDRSLTYKKPAYKFDAKKYFLLVIHRFKIFDEELDQEREGSLVHQITLQKNCKGFFVAAT